MGFMPGTTEVPEEAIGACIASMAAMLARIHEMPTDALPELPERLDPLPELFEFIPEHGWADLLKYLREPRSTRYSGTPRLLHGDFWPGNVLWHKGEISAVLDWEDAALGDPLSDVAACRLELMHAYGADAFDAFTHAYGRYHDIDHRRLDLWQIYVGLAAARYMSGWGLAPQREAAMRRNAIATSHDAAERLMSG